LRAWVTAGLYSFCWLRQRTKHDEEEAMKEGKQRSFCRGGIVAALILMPTLAGCAGRYGSMRLDARIAQDLGAAQVLAGHRYYTTGSELEPAAIVALREDRPLRGAWREIAATPALLAKLCSEMQGTRLVLPDGAVILDDRGERIGVWYSYLAFPPPPKLLDDGSVELATPFVPSDGGDGRPGLPR
jgi:hypothetical protein